MSIENTCPILLISLSSLILYLKPTYHIQKFKVVFIKSPLEGI